MLTVNLYLKITTSLLLSLLISACSASEPPKSLQENDLLGNWCARKNPAFYEEFVLEIDDGKHVFRSYLHQRPDEFGSWTLSKNQFTIIGNSGRTSAYKIAEFSTQALVLMSDLGDKEYYYRDGCVAIAEPSE